MDVEDGINHQIHSRNRLRIVSFRLNSSQHLGFPGLLLMFVVYYYTTELLTR